MNYNIGRQWKVTHKNRYNMSLTRMLEEYLGRVKGLEGWEESHGM